MEGAAITGNFAHMWGMMACPGKSTSEPHTLHDLQVQPLEAPADGKAGGEVSLGGGISGEEGPPRIVGDNFRPFPDRRFSGSYPILLE